MSEKFNFANNFDHLTVTGRAMALNNNPEAMRAAEKKGHEKGFQEGHIAAYKEIDATTNMLLTTLSGQMEKMLRQQQKIHTTLEEQTLSLAFEAFEKLLPSFVAADKCQTSFQRIGEAMRLLDSDKEITLKVSPTLHDIIQKKMASPQIAAEISPHLIIATSDHLDPPDFLLSWQGGSLAYVQRRLEQALLTLLSPPTTEKDVAPLSPDKPMTPTTGD